MAGVRTKRELAAIKREAQDAVRGHKADIAEGLSEYKKLSRIVKKTCDTYKKSCKTVEKKRSARVRKRHERTLETYRFALSEYNGAEEKLLASLDLLHSEYEKLVDAYRSRGNVKAIDRTYKIYDKYRDSVLSAIDKVDRRVPDAPTFDEPVFDDPIYDDPVDTPVTEAAVEAPATAERSTPPVRPAEVSSTVTTVTVAPVTIDVTPIVERAIDSFIERLSAGLTRRIDEYTRDLTLPTVGASAAAVPAQHPSAPDGEVIELSSELLSEEEHIVEKLRGMCVSISALLEELTALSSSYHDASVKCRELAELQRTVNDMQRHTAREQKGVQVNQKLVADEQAEIIAAETLVLESQRELAERQSAVAARQSEVTALGAENAEAAENNLARERELSERQAELAALGRKLADATEQANLRQNELYLEQKEAISRTKKLIREQRQLAEKVGIAPKRKKEAVKAEESAPTETGAEISSDGDTPPSEE